MENSQPTSEKLLNLLKVGGLDALIVKIVHQVLQQETQKLQQEDLSNKPTQANYLPQAFLETFGNWADTRTAEEIIDDIYSSRSVSDRNYLF
ncbi:hypothetical protein NIES2100_38610 [Calothrix sp. NIES-2100]|uniref:hypothetical protein n=1 Tax=Calothrix sp. NIES-2100 TaxID=1954172 RepID=UPI000B5EE3B7|nr:hypothetical protein NIES2100_38610 [Calothrix sp. NIES-2100]